MNSILTALIALMSGIVGLFWAGIAVGIFNVPGVIALIIYFLVSIFINIKLREFAN